MMPVPLTATQPPAQQLVSYNDFLDRIHALKSSPRVKVPRIGRSHAGRGLYSIIIASEEATPFPGSPICSVSANEAAGTEGHISVAPSDAGESDRRTRFPVLIMGLSFGHEAAHVEALLELADRLAWSNDPDTIAILSKLVVLIVPMVNPDGRMVAVETWTRYPCAADASAGNLYGFLLNRDFLHLIQPETTAILNLYRDWRPIALLDTHEDVYLLGVQVPELCWCPAFGLSTVRDAPEGIREIVKTVGLSIADEWREAGFVPYRQDMFMWSGSSSQREIEWLFGMDGNIVQTMSIHGIPAVITESARTPGTQTWEDRIRQKLLAGLSFLRAVAERAPAIAGTISSNRSNKTQESAESSRTFVIPILQHDSGAVAAIIRNLLQHGVEVYETTGTFDAFVIPLAQAEARIALSLLSSKDSRIHALPPALGASVAETSDLSSSQRAILQRQPIQPVMDAPLPSLRFELARTNAPYAILNTPDGVRLVNRLLAAGYGVSWVVEPSFTDGMPIMSGTFIIKTISPDVLTAMGRGLYYTARSISTSTPLKTLMLRHPRVAFYVGQGTDGLNAAARAELWWALEKMEFDFAAVDADAIEESTLRNFDALFIPAGQADEIVRGWSRESLLSKSPWELPGEPKGIGEVGLKALRAFVAGGGTYFGIDSGGGLLALEPYAQLMSAEVAAHSLGLARVVLRVEEPNNPVMFGLTGSYDNSGRWREGFFPAIYYTELLDGAQSGLVFRTSSSVRVLATYYEVEYETPRQIASEALLTAQGKTAAILFNVFGKGRAIVTGVRPGFRGVWRNTWRLLSNSAFLSVASKT